MPLRPFNREQGWLLPPTLDQLIGADHPARFVAAFVDGLDGEAWASLEMDLEGAPMGAGAYHPRALLSIWLYGFMTGVRSSRKLEAACRDQIPFLWLAGMQQPDHNTLWRFYKAHRDPMRGLLRCTVQVAVKADLVDLVLQAVDGTKIAGNASRARVYDSDGLRGVLARVEAAIADLEAANATGGDPPPARLPEDLARAEALRRRVSEAIARVEEEDGPRYTNLTDPDASAAPFHVPRAGKHPLLPPPPYGVGMGPQAAGDLRPRQAGLLLEPLQAMREVVGEAVGDSPVVSALSRHGVSPAHGRPQSPPQEGLVVSRAVRRQTPFSHRPLSDHPHVRAFLVAWKAKRRPPARSSRPARKHLSPVCWRTSCCPRCIWPLGYGNRLRRDWLGACC